MLRQQGGILIKIMTVILILIILLLVGGGAYLYFTFKPLLAEMKFQKSVAPTSTSVSDKHPLLNSSQEKALEFIGVDAAKLPTSITPELKKCAITKLGTARVAELLKGATPGISDFLKAKKCLKK